VDYLERKRGDTMIKNQKGATLLELIIAMVMLSMFLSVLYVATSGLTDDISRQRNEVFPSELAHMIKEHYLLNTYEVDTNPNSTYVTTGTNIPSGSLSTNIVPSLTNMVDTVTYSNMTFRDGYNQPMLILVSELLEKNYEGVMIPYRVFSVVSTANEDVMGAGTFGTTMDVTTGQVDVDPEETAVTINTFQEQLSKFEASKEKVERISRAYSHYYWSRHNLGMGDISKDYFASGGASWDQQAGSKVSRSCVSGGPDNINGYNTPGVRASNVNFANALGLSADFEVNDWGRPMYIMNCGSIGNVLSGGSTLTITPRNPDSPNAGRRIQPFNAVIGFTMPNGESYFQVISSRT
jgi:Tfp pilus assembly protein PilE